MPATVTAIPQSQRRGRRASSPAHQAAEVLPPVADADVDETTSLTFDEIENLLLRIHGRTDAMKACVGLSGTTKGNVDMTREQLAALLDLMAEGIKLLAYEIQDTVAGARRQMGMYRQPVFGRF